MQRHKSAKKAARKSKKANAINRARRSHLKNAIRSVLELKDRKKAEEALKKAFSALDKSVKIKIIHANNAANKKALLCRHVNKLAK